MRVGRYVLDRSGSLPSFLPEGFDLEGWVELCEFGASWMKYVNVHTGQLVDCADVYKEYLLELGGKRESR